MKVPEVRLRKVEDVPLFGWARKADVQIWIDMVKAFQSKAHLPAAPPVEQNLWAPSGMENLDNSFQWAIANSTGDQKDLWKFYYGTWLAGRGDAEGAIRVLSGTKTGVAKVLLARLLKLKGDLKFAKQSFDAINEKWLLLHPQVVVARDKLLRSLGPATISVCCF